jgi:hypothetical protein
VPSRRARPLDLDDLRAITTAGLSWGSTRCGAPGAARLVAVLGRMSSGCLAEGDWLFDVSGCACCAWSPVGALIASIRLASGLDKVRGDVIEFAPSLSSVRAVVFVSVCVAGAKLE